jgi:hypothetical protein
VEALAANDQLRLIRIGGHEVALGAGWVKGEVVWDSNEAVKASPATAGVVLGSCTCLTRLSLRLVAYQPAQLLPDVHEKKWQIELPME